MRGFVDSTNPVWLHVSSEVEGILGAEGPFQIDGARAEREADGGILVTVGETRYLVPAGQWTLVTQLQPAPETPQDPEETPPGGGGGGGNEDPDPV